MALAMAALIAMATPWAPGASADPSAAAHVTRLDLVSYGMTVGHGRIIRAPTLRNGKSCMQLRLIIETKVNLLFYKFYMHMQESWITDASGLIAYTYDSLENGRSKTITGELRDGIFHFETVAAGQKSVWTAPRAAYAFASISQPEPALTEGEVKKYSVLDPSTCTVTERTYRGTGMEMLTVGNRKIQCNTITIEYPGTSIRRWIIADEFGPLILREEGSQPRGSYSHRAVSMDLEQPALNP